VVDDFAEGVVTSIKSIDLNAGTYQSGSRLLARINRYIDQVSRFDGARWNNVEVSSSAIEGRSLRLVIPKGSGTAEQQAAISAAEARAGTLSKSVKLIVSPF
jgi:filamentous hemagglutinin